MRRIHLTVVGMTFTLALSRGRLTAAATEEAKPNPAVQRGLHKRNRLKTDGANQIRRNRFGKTESVKKTSKGGLKRAAGNFELLEQQRMLDKREATLRGSETHLLEMKAELEQIVTATTNAVDAEKKRQQAAQSKAGKDAEKAKPAAKAARWGQLEPSPISEDL